MARQEQVAVGVDLPAISPYLPAWRIARRRGIAAPRQRVGGAENVPRASGARVGSRVQDNGGYEQPARLWRSSIAHINERHPPEGHAFGQCVFMSLSQELTLWNVIGILSVLLEASASLGIFPKLPMEALPSVELAVQLPHAVMVRSILGATPT